jgi:hypothetical protein
MVQKREEKENNRKNIRVSGGAKKVKKIRAVGTRAQVWHGSADHTASGLKKSAFKLNKYGRIVSRKMSERASREKRLVKAGFIPKKGVFKLFKKSDGKKKTRKMTKKTTRK